MSRGEISIIGLDLAKNVFQVLGAGVDGSVIFQSKLSRAQLQKFMAAQPPCLVAIEACASAHHLGRAMSVLGHESRLIPCASWALCAKKPSSGAKRSSLKRRRHRARSECAAADCC